jgi:hypothetical protein
MNKKHLITIVIFSLIVAAYSSCEKISGNETNISSYGDSESHNMGKNCMDCHKKGGNGKGRFIIAGTVYDTNFITTFSNPTLKLYTLSRGAGELAKTLEGDARGNFYTTESVNFGPGLFPAIIGNSGKTSYMSGSVKTGACNSCHNYTNCKIWVR